MDSPRPAFARLALAVILCSFVWAAPAGSGAPTGVLRIAYFVPSDRKALADRVERLDRVMTEVQSFYREGMRQNGYGALTFPLDRNPDGSLRIFQVDGRYPMSEYGRKDAWKINQEVKEALTRQGLDPNRETIVVFQLLLEWRDGKAVELGPFVGSSDGGTWGMAWVYDDERLDSRLLKSTKPGGYYGRPCSVGEFNSHYIGGIAHELGHGLGLPHDCERLDERKSKGRSLMGGGNHTYGQELRREGRGSFLSAASAMMLSRHPLFAGTQPPDRRKETCKMAELQASYAGGKLRLDGSLEAQPPAFGIIGYNDDKSIQDDYDAVSWTGEVGKDGRFRLEIGDLKPGTFELRLRPCLEDGRTQVFRYPYTVNAAGKPDITSFQQEQLLQQATAAYVAKDRGQLRSLARSAQTSAPGAVREVNHLLALLDPWPRVAPMKIPASRRMATITELSLESAKTGWGGSLYDQVLAERNESCLLRIGGEFFDSGLFAHAPAAHVLRLGKKWKTFRSGYGMQDRHNGSVVFVVKGDGKELFRSPLVRGDQRHDMQVDVSRVDVLELLVEDGGDGRTDDWGVWVATRLER